jgi:16S rRNA G527 N7-methylase RsmG
MTTMDNAVDLASEATDADPAVGLRAVAALRKLLDRLEALQVDNARALGWSWQAIADDLHVSKQAVHKKHRERRLFRRGG